MGLWGKPIFSSQVPFLYWFLTLFFEVLFVLLLSLGCGSTHSSAAARRAAGFPPSFGKDPMLFSWWDRAVLSLTLCVCKHLYATGHIFMVVNSHSESKRFSSNCLGQKKVTVCLQRRHTDEECALETFSEGYLALCSWAWFFFSLRFHKNRRMISCCLFYLCYLQKGVAELILSLACFKEYSRQVSSDIYSNNFCYFSQSSGTPFQKTGVLQNQRHRNWLCNGNSTGAFWLLPYQNWHSHSLNTWVTQVPCEITGWVSS